MDSRNFFNKGVKRNLENDLVEISIRVPKRIHEFMQKIAALEGSPVTEWYELWIGMQFESAMSSDLEGMLDMKKVLHHNGLEQVLGDQASRHVWG